jgi:parallel beta-helix repeat protein
MLVFVLATSFVLVVAANPQPANEPAYNIKIESDGTVTGRTVSGTDNIQRNGKNYSLTGNIVGCLVIAQNDIILDGKEFALDGDGSKFGIFVKEATNVTIKNMIVTNCQTGVMFSFDNPPSKGYNNLVINNKINHNKNGISLYGVNCSVKFNVISNNENGITLFWAENSEIIGNIISDNQKGIFFSSYAWDSMIYGNSFYNNTSYDVYSEERQANSRVKWDNGTAGNYWSNFNPNTGSGKGYQFKVSEDNFYVDNFPLNEPVTQTDSPTQTTNPINQTIIPIITGATIAGVIIISTILLIYRKTKNASKTDAHLA